VTIVLEKDRLRRVAAGAIAALSKDDRQRAHVAIATTLRALGAYRDSEQVLAYQPLADEVDILALIDVATREGRAVFLPVVSNARELIYRRWNRDDVLLRSPLGVLEPTGGELPRQVRSIVLVPGRVFSANGWRIGRGGGYYDRALPNLSRYGATVGIAYACQILPQVPHDERDRRVDLVVSERGASVASRSGGTDAVADADTDE